jgi:hypothetical protein
MVAPGCFGITSLSSGSVPSAFWEMINWGAVDRILWMGVLFLVTWCVRVMSVTQPECNCSLRYLACNVHEPYCTCGLPRSTTLLYIFHKRHDYQKQKVTEHKTCVLILPTTFVWNISHSKKKWARYGKKNCIGLHVKYSLFMSDFNETLIFSTDLLKILKHQIL